MKISVIGAGVMGCWTAYCLLQEGHEVTLVESIYPGHSRSSSGGESRLIRGIYGQDTIYMDWVQQSLLAWKSLEQKVQEQIFYPAGTLWMFGDDSAYGDFAFNYLQSIDWPIHPLALDTAEEQFPQINFTEIQKIYFEPESGYLMARRGCQLLKKQFIKEGGQFLQQTIPSNEQSWITGKHPLEKSDMTIFACGPWTKSLFPVLLSDYLQISRQEIYYFTTKNQSPLFNVNQMPTWIDLSSGNFYGVPITDQRGFKLADDTRRSLLEIDQADRSPTPSLIAEMKQYIQKRFPTFKNPILSESRVCQYANTPDGHFIIDFLPGRKDMMILTGGSGHAYKLGPAIGQQVVRCLRDPSQHVAQLSLERFTDTQPFQDQFKRKNSFY